MLREIQTMLCLAVSAVICSCERPSAGDEKQAFSGVGTCVPITVHDEFVFLSWYELININAESKLEEFRNPSAEWRMRMLKEAGFNIYFEYRQDSLEETEALLELGDKVGMKIVTECPELHDSTTTRMAVEAMSAHPSLYAYNVSDEPEVYEYPEAIRRIKEIYKYDQKHPCYVNIYPNYAWDEWVEERYLETVRHYLKTIPVSFLSFDYYPVIVTEDGTRTLREAWYHNLEDIRTAALEAKVPIWSFALAKPHAVYPWPTLGDLRVQHFSNLVYGAVAFQYFTTRAIVWRDAVTELYPLVKQVNHELKQMEKIFLGADIKGIWHTGKESPRGTKELTEYPAGITNIETGECGAVVSYFTNNGKRYVALVNKDFVGESTLKISFDGEAAEVAKDGSESPVAASYAVEPGDIKIFTWK